MSAETLTLGAPREGTFLLRALVSVVFVLGIVVLLSDLLAVDDVVMPGPDRPGGGATREQISQAGIKVVRVSVLVAAAVLPTGARLVTAARARLSPNILGGGILAVVLLVPSSLATLPVAA